MSLTELFERFKKDITYDAHGLTARYCRSVATEELVVNRASPETLRSIIVYLRTNDNVEKGCKLGDDLNMAWIKLIKDMLIEIKVDTKTAPDKIEVPAWCDWAERQLTA